jgi:hypothetical protein
MSKLVFRLGEYSPRPEGITVADREQEPVERVVKSGVKNDWGKFKTARDTYFKEKKEESKTLKDSHKEELNKLRERQKSERNAVFAVSWKGRGAILNRTRSVMAAKHLGEKLDLLDSQKMDADALNMRFPRSFVSFKEWLEREKDPSALLSFRYPNQGTIHGNGASMEGAPTDLRAFTPTFGNKGGVAYSRDGAHAEFIDYGKRIVLGSKLDEAVVLAALQLANQKWGGALINGTDEYKKICVELAARHNLKISNPELAVQVESSRKRIRERERERERERSEESEQGR